MSMGPWVSCRAVTWLIDECPIDFFMSCLMLRKLDLFVIIFYDICLAANNLSGILDTPMGPFLFKYNISPSEGVG